MSPKVRSPRASLLFVVVCIVTAGMAFLRPMPPPKFRSFSKFKIAIETLNVPAQRDSEGNIVFDENVLPYTPEELKKRKVQVVDIADSADVDAGTYSAATDPKLVASLKAGRGPLSENWFQQWGDRPCMIAYKKVVISCAYFGIAGTVEDYLEGYERSLFKGTHSAEREREDKKTPTVREREER